MRVAITMAVLAVLASTLAAVTPRLNFGGIDLSCECPAQPALGGAGTNIRQGEETYRCKYAEGECEWDNFVRQVLSDVGSKRC